MQLLGPHPVEREVAPERIAELERLGRDDRRQLGLEHRRLRLEIRAIPDGRQRDLDARCGVQVAGAHAQRPRRDARRLDALA
ncbi:MAG: hypothetical protein WKG01_36045 [Kofleriaceae bacterium]